MENNRRNYYRILGVQPDANFSVIRNNYRILLQKFRMHPDLGGNNCNASLLNIAYNTLKSPLKRASYDKKLLKQYKIRTISQGHLRNTYPNIEVKNAGHNDINKRNYYRILNIQPDAPNAIVTASYKTLIHRPRKGVPSHLLSEAHETLTNPMKRTLYDRLLKQTSHAYAVEKLQNVIKNKEKQKKLMPYRHNSRLMHKPRHIIQNTKSTAPVVTERNIGYRSIITHYCVFCFTPHNHSPSGEQHFCIECESPLNTPPNSLIELKRRELSRIIQEAPLIYFEDWPGINHTGLLNNISPMGLRFETEKKIEHGKIIKIDSENFKAAGRVTYCDKISHIYSIGINFLTVYFRKNKGQFFKASA